MCITPDKVIFLASQRQAQYLETLKTEEAKIPIDILKRTKDAEENAVLFKQLLDEISKSKDGVSG